MSLLSDECNSMKLGVACLHVFPLKPSSGDCPPADRDSKEVIRGEFKRGDNTCVSRYLAYRKSVCIYL